MALNLGCYGTSLSQFSDDLRVAWKRRTRRREGKPFPLESIMVSDMKCYMKFQNLTEYHSNGQRHHVHNHTITPALLCFAFAYEPVGGDQLEYGGPGSSLPCVCALPDGPLPPAHRWQRLSLTLSRSVTSPWRVDSFILLEGRSFFVIVHQCGIPALLAMLSFAFGNDVGNSGFFYHTLFPFILAHHTYYPTLRPSKYIHHELQNLRFVTQRVKCHI